MTSIISLVSSDDEESVAEIPLKGQAVKSFAGAKVLGGETLSSCLVCKKIVTCKYNINCNGHMKNLCNEKCFAAFRKEAILYVQPAKAAKVVSMDHSPANSVLRCCVCSGVLRNLDLSVQHGKQKFLFCSKVCLSKQDLLGLAKSCFRCKKSLSSGTAQVRILVEGKVQDFCNFSCFQMDDHADSRQACRMCMGNINSSQYSLLNNDKPFKFCSHDCLQKYCTFVQLSPSEKCVQCCNQLILANKCEMQLEGVVHKFCRTDCRDVYKKLSQRKIPCTWCKGKVYNTDMIERVDLNNKCESFCSMNCLSIHRLKVNAKVSSCEGCGTAVLPKYHLTMSDGSVKNFCNYKCVAQFQESYSKGAIVSNENSGARVAPAANQSNATQLLEWREETESRSSYSLCKDAAKIVDKMDVNCLLLSANKAKAAGVNKTGVVATSPIKIFDGTAQPTDEVSNIAQDVPFDGEKAVQFFGSDGQVQREVIFMPAKPPLRANKSTIVRPVVLSRSVSCSPTVADKSIQTEAFHPSIVPIPVPLPVPMPLAMYSLPIPYPLPIPVPILVPIFIPTTKNSSAEIFQHIKEIQEKIPSDPFEAELLVMAEAVALAEEVNTEASPIGRKLGADELERSDVDVGPTKGNFLLDEQKVFEIALDMGEPQKEPLVENLQMINTDAETQLATESEELVATGTLAVTGEFEATGVLAETKALTTTGILTNTEAPVATRVVKECEVPMATGILMESEVPMATRVLMESEVPMATGVLMESEVPMATGVLMESEVPMVTGVLMESEVPMVTGVLMESEVLMSTGVLAEAEAPTTTGVLAEAEAPTTTGVLPEKETLTYAENTFPIMTEYHCRDERCSSDHERKSFAKLKRKKEVENNETTKLVCKRMKASESSVNELRVLFGVNAWMSWADGKFCQGQKFAREYLLCCTPDELSLALCRFVVQVRKPNGDEFSPDSILYICLGIQKYLNMNGRCEDIFTDSLFTPFRQNLHDLLLSYEVLANQQGQLMCRIEEEHLWQSDQLGVKTPHILLNTLVYFNCKYFMLKNATDHTNLKISQVVKHWKKASGTSSEKISYLKYHPGVGNMKQNLIQMTNAKCIERCPIRLYDFYLAKCPQSRKLNDIYYRVPEISCVPESPVWYSSQPMSQEVLHQLLVRFKLVREIQEILIYKESL